MYVSLFQYLQLINYAEVLKIDREVPGPGPEMLRLRSESCLRRKVKVVAENAECFYTGYISAAEQHSSEFVTGGEVMIKLYSVPSAILQFNLNM